MPSPDEKQAQANKRQLEILNALLGDQTELTLVHEVAQLRREIQALRQELCPSPDQIITGRAAMAEFQRLTMQART
jgi:hypothetical protein